MGVEQVNRGSYISAHVLLNLLSKLRISDKLRVLLAFYGFCATNLINSIIQEQECYILYIIKIVSEYDQEIPQSQTADNPLASRGRAA